MLTLHVVQVVASLVGALARPGMLEAVYPSYEHAAVADAEVPYACHLADPSQCAYLVARAEQA